MSKYITYFFFTNNNFNIMKGNEKLVGHNKNRKAIPKVLVYIM